MQETKETQFQSLGQEDPLEEGMATHSSTLAWRIPMNRGAWPATVHRIANRGTQLERLIMYMDTQISLLGNSPTVTASTQEWRDSNPSWPLSVVGIKPKLSPSGFLPGTLNPEQVTNLFGFQSQFSSSTKTRLFLYHGSHCQAWGAA